MLVTTDGVHGFSVSDPVTVAGVVPAGYNGAGEVLSVPAPDQVELPCGYDPGAYVAGGTIS
jgi:hypothetical protein